MTDTANTPQTPALLQPRFIFSHYTPDRGCGGTDGDVFLVLKGDGVQYPPPGKWYRLDNSGNDRERGDTDSYWLETGSMRSVHTCRLYFVPKGGAPAWELSSSSLNKWKWNATLGRWQLSEFRNYWRYNTCLRSEGWYSRVDRDLHTASQFNAALQLHAKDPETFEAVIELSMLSHSSDLMRINDNRPSVESIPDAVDLDLSPEVDDYSAEC